MTVSMAVGVAVGVAVGMTIGGTICSICSLDCPIFMDRLFQIQRKGNHQIGISSNLVPKNISQLMRKPSIISNSNPLVQHPNK